MLNITFKEYKAKILFGFYMIIWFIWDNNFLTPKEYHIGKTLLQKSIYLIKLSSFSMDFQLKSDQDLIHLYISGDEGGLVELIRRYQSKIYTSIYLLVKDEYLAEDIFQDTFIKVINTLKANKYNEEGKFLPWVTRIAHNLVIDHFRREKRAPMISNGDDFDIFEVLGNYDESTEDRMVREQTYKDLKSLIHLLPAEQKEVLIMRHFGDMSFKEIADITDVSINTALGRMRYALNNLRKMMQSKEMSLKN